jgi:hypothetical protein
MWHFGFYERLWVLLSVSRKVKTPFWTGFSHGGPCWTRTNNPLIKSTF